MVSCDVRGGKYVLGTVLRGYARSTMQHFLMTRDAYLYVVQRFHIGETHLQYDY